MWQRLQPHVYIAALVLEVGVLQAHGPPQEQGLAIRGPPGITGPLGSNAISPYIEPVCGPDSALSNRTVY